MKYLASALVAVVLAVALVSTTFAQGNNTIRGVTAEVTIGTIEWTTAITTTSTITINARYREGTSGDWTVFTGQTTNTDGDLTWDSINLKPSTLYQFQAATNTSYTQNLVQYTATTSKSPWNSANFAFDRAIGSSRRNVWSVTYDGARLNFLSPNVQSDNTNVDGRPHVFTVSISSGNEDGHGSNSSWSDAEYSAGLVYVDNKYAMILNRELWTWDDHDDPGASTHVGNVGGVGVRQDMCYDRSNDRVVTVVRDTDAPIRQRFHSWTDLIGDRYTVTSHGQWAGDENDNYIESIACLPDGQIMAVLEREYQDRTTSQRARGNYHRIVLIPDIDSPISSWVDLGYWYDSNQRRFTIVYTGSEVVGIGSAASGNVSKRLYIHTPPATIETFGLENEFVLPRLEASVGYLTVDGGTIYTRARLFGAETWTDLDSVAVTPLNSVASIPLPGTLRIPAQYEAEASLNSDFSDPTYIRYTVPTPLPTVTNLSITQAGATTPELQALLANIFAADVLHARIRTAGTATWTDLPDLNIDQGATAALWPIDRMTFAIGSYEAQASFDDTFPNDATATAVFLINQPPISFQSVVYNAPSVMITVAHPSTNTAVYRRYRKIEDPLPDWTAITSAVVSPTQLEAVWTPAPALGVGSYAFEAAFSDTFSDAVDIVFTVLPDSALVGASGITVSWTGTSRVSNFSNIFFVNRKSSRATVSSYVLSSGSADPVVSGKFILSEMCDISGDCARAILAIPGDSITTKNVSHSISRNGDVIARDGAITGVGNTGIFSHFNLRPLGGRGARPVGRGRLFTGDRLIQYHQARTSDVYFRIMEVDADAPEAQEWLENVANGDTNGGTGIFLDGEREDVNIRAALIVNKNKFEWVYQPAGSVALISGCVRTDSGGFGTINNRTECVFEGSVSLSLRLSIEAFGGFGLGDNNPYLAARLDRPVGDVTNVYARIKPEGAADFSTFTPATIEAEGFITDWAMPRGSTFAIDSFPLGNYIAEASLMDDFSNAVEAMFEIVFPVPANLVVDPQDDGTADATWDEITITDIKYQVRWRDFYNVDDNFFVSPEVATNSYTITELEPGASYVTQVRALTTATTGDWGDQIAFTMPPGARPTPEPEPDQTDWCRPVSGVTTLRLTPGQYFTTVGGRFEFSAFSFMSGTASVSVDPSPRYFVVTKVDGHEINCELTEVIDGVAVFKTDPLTGASFTGNIREIEISTEQVTPNLGGINLGSLNANMCYSSNAIMGGGCGATLMFIFPAALMLIAFFALGQRNGLILTGVGVFTSLAMALILGSLVAIGIFVIMLAIGGGIIFAKIQSSG